MSRPATAGHGMRHPITLDPCPACGGAVTAVVVTEEALKVEPCGHRVAVTLSTHHVYLELVS